MNPDTHDPNFAGDHRAPRTKLRMTFAILGTLLAVGVVASLLQFARADDSRDTAAGNAADIGSAAPVTPAPGASGSAAAVPSASGAPSSKPAASPSSKKAAAARDSGPCGAFPRFPNASCTGWQHTGVKLRSCKGTITKSNAKLDKCRFSSGLTIQAKNVTITRSLVQGRVGATYLTDWSLGGLKLVDVEIDGGGGVDPNGEAAIGSNDYSCVRCHIHGTGRGANMERNVTIRDSYLHGWVYTEGAHQTAIGSNGGGNFTVVHNNLECQSEGCSAALSLYGDFAPINGALIENNLFNTDGGYCTYGGSTTAKPFPIGKNIRYVNNVFGKKFGPKCGYYGPVATFEMHEGNQWVGNRWADGGNVKPQA